MQSLLCARFEQQKHQQNDALKRKNPGFHLNQRCTWVLPVDERDFYRKSRRLSVAGAETKMQRVAANKGARASGWYSRSAAQIFARKQGSNNDRERERCEAKWKPGLMVHWWRSILKLHCDLIQCERKQCRRWIIIIMTACARVSRRRWMNSFERSSESAPPEMMMIPCEMARNAPSALHAQRIITAFLSAPFFNPIVAATAVFFIFSLSHKKLFPKLKSQCFFCPQLRSVMFRIQQEILHRRFFTRSPIGMGFLDYFFSQKDIFFRLFLRP